MNVKSLVDVEMGKKAAAGIGCDCVAAAMIEVGLDREARRKAEGETNLGV